MEMSIKLGLRGQISFRKTKPLASSSESELCVDGPALRSSRWHRTSPQVNKDIGVVNIHYLNDGLWKNKSFD